MIDPIANFVHVLALIFERLPGAYIDLVGVYAIFAGFIIFFRIMRSL